MKIKNVEMPEPWPKTKLGTDPIGWLLDKPRNQELSSREMEIMKEQNITMDDIISPGNEDGKCGACKKEPNIPGMWVCANCYDSRNK